MRQPRARWIFGLLVVYSILRERILPLLSVVRILFKYRKFAMTMDNIDDRREAGREQLVKGTRGLKEFSTGEGENARVGQLLGA